MSHMVHHELVIQRSNLTANHFVVIFSSFDVVMLYILDSWSCHGSNNINHHLFVLQISLGQQQAGHVIALLEVVSG
jgi:hypothetical protein